MDGHASLIEYNRSIVFFFLGGRERQSIYLEFRSGFVEAGPLGVRSLWENDAGNNYGVKEEDSH